MGMKISETTTKRVVNAWGYNMVTALFDAKALNPEVKNVDDAEARHVNEAIKIALTKTYKLPESAFEGSGSGIEYSDDVLDLLVEKGFLTEEDRDAEKGTKKALNRLMGSVVLGKLKLSADELEVVKPYIKQ